jgi:hypothetical protein
MKPHDRVGDVVPSQVSDEELRLLYGADAEVIIGFRQSLGERSGERVENVEGRHGREGRAVEDAASAQEGEAEDAT